MARSSSNVFKKRKGGFNKKGSQKTSEEKFVNSANVLSENPLDTANLSSDSVNISSSEKKLLNENNCYSNNFAGYKNVIVDINILAGVFFEAVKCLECGMAALHLKLNENNWGAAVQFYLECANCNYEHSFFSSKQDDNDIYEVNNRLVYAMRCIGKGAESARMFCGVMNLPPPPTKFAKYNACLVRAAKEVCEESMNQGVQEAVVENDGNRDLAVAVDGSWQKRGFTSKNGIVTITSVDTGKVLDVEIFSKHCTCPNKKNHLEGCKRNFEGYSGKMEVDGAVSMFQRSESKHEVRYVKYLGDGDSKAFDSVVGNNVYGDECPIKKLECIGHVQKRMGTRLRRLKTKMKGLKLSDGKPLSGKGRLTDAEIDRLQTYYGLAIRKNCSNVKDMRQAIWAIFLHKLSTDENPQHGFCPSDADTWCKFKKAELLGAPFHHKNSLPVAVVEAMRPIFTDLSHPDLLKKCLHGKTQNPNESVNNVIWSRIPKKTFVHLEVLSLGTYDAICTFNVGNSTKLQILKKLNIEPGDYAVEAMKRLDDRRVSKAKYANLQRTKEVRKVKRLKRKREEDDNNNNVDKVDYGAGEF